MSRETTLATTLVELADTLVADIDAAQAMADVAHNIIDGTLAATTLDPEGNEFDIQ